MLSLLAIPLAIFFFLAPVYSEEVLKKRIEELKSKADPTICYQLGIYSLNDAINLIKSLNYIPDYYDVTKSPIETVLTGGGDCEDFAVLSYSLLKCLGYDPKIVIAYNPNDPEAHAFTFIQLNDYLLVFSNNNVFKSPSLEETLKHLNFTKVVVG